MSNNLKSQTTQHTYIHTYIRRSIVVCLFVIASLNAYSQTDVPRIITYQGMLQQEGGQANGLHDIVVRLYANPHATEMIWKGRYAVQVTSGIFAIALGAGKYPLPNVASLDKQLWVGISVDGSDELRPLTQLTSSPYALNVADRSITRSKLADDILPILSGQEKTTTGVEWHTGGNIGTASGDFVGTGDNAPLIIKVDSIQTMKYIPINAAEGTTNIIGGYAGNSITGGGNVIAGGGRYDGSLSVAHPNRIGSTISSAYSFIGGGVDNDLDGSMSVLGGGSKNTLSGQGSVLTGGKDNTVSDANYSVISGGENNTVTKDYGFIGGGTANEVTDEFGTVAGGGNNKAKGKYSSVLGGSGNEARGQYSSVLGGTGLIITANNSAGFAAPHSAGMSLTDSNVFLLGNVDLWLKNNNMKEGQLRLYVSSGYGTYYSGFRTSFVGQSSNILYYLPSALGSPGQVLKLSSTSSTEGHLTWGDAGDDAWKLTGNAGTTSIGDGGSNYLGTSDNKAFEIRINQSGSSTEGRRRVMRYEPNSVSPNIVGGFNGNTIANGVVGGLIFGGGENGKTNTINADYGIIVGGTNNRVDSVYGFIGGGDTNIVRGRYSAVLNGTRNFVFASNSVIAGGDSNRITGAFGTYGTNGGSFIGSGVRNVATSQASFIGGGDSNTVGNNFGVIGGGFRNFVDGVNAEGSVIVGGGRNKTEGSLSFIGGGGTITGNVSGGNLTQGALSAIVGGSRNTTGGNRTFIGGGSNNTTNAVHSLIVGGDSNTVRLANSSIGGGQKNNIPAVVGSHVTIPGGHRLTGQSYAQTVMGTHNKAQGISSITDFRGQDPVDPMGTRIARVNDRLLIVGNGTFRDSTAQNPPPNDTVITVIDSSNAFEVNNRGAAIVYGKLSRRSRYIAGDVTSRNNPSLNTNPNPDPSVFGAVMQDNIIMAWGDVPPATFGNVIPNSSYGVDSIRFVGLNEYIITLRLAPTSTDDDQTSNMSQASITVTPSYPFNSTALVLISAVVSQISNNQFKVWTFRHNMTTGEITRAAEAFMFKVVGRRP